MPSHPSPVGGGSRAAPPDPPDAQDVEAVRLLTGGADAWSDQQLTDLIARWTCTDAAGVESYDLYAASAVVLEQTLIQAQLQPLSGAQQVQAGDLRVQYGSGGAGGSMRYLIDQYWRRACPENQAKGRRSGWGVVDVLPPGASVVAELPPVLFPQQVLNRVESQAAWEEQLPGLRKERT